MNPQRHTLSESLRELAANSPQASPVLGVRLQQAFARHHAQRRLRKRAVFAVSLAACLAIAVAWLRTGKRRKTSGNLDLLHKWRKRLCPSQRLSRRKSKDLPCR